MSVRVVAAPVRLAANTVDQDYQVRFPVHARSARSKYLVADHNIEIDPHEDEDTATRFRKEGNMTALPRISWSARLFAIAIAAIAIAAAIVAIILRVHH